MDTANRVLRERRAFWREGIVNLTGGWFTGHHRDMNRATNSYAGYRYPAEIISHAVWLYFRFTLSLRDIEEVLAARGILVTYEVIRQWCLKFGQPFANAVQWRLPRPGDK